MIEMGKQKILFSFELSKRGKIALCFFVNMKAGMLCDIGCKCGWRNIFQLSDGVVGSLFQATTFNFMLVFTHTLNASKMYIYVPGNFYHHLSASSDLLKF